MNAETQARTAAEAFRNEYHLGTQPLTDLITVIEQSIKVDVAVLAAGADEHGLTIRDPKSGAVFIGVASTANPMRQRSTLAHELAHVVFKDWAEGEPGDSSERSPEEVRADAFARHLLLPLAGLKEFLGARTNIAESALSDVVQRFLVSPQIAAIALHQAEYINLATKQAWLAAQSAPQLASRYGWLDLYQALAVDSNVRRSPQRLLYRAITGYELGVVSAQTIATLRGIGVATAEAELQQAGVRPVGPDISWSPADDLPTVTVDLAELDNDLAGNGG